MSDISPLLCNHTR